MEPENIDCRRRSRSMRRRQLLVTGCLLLLAGVGVGVFEAVAHLGGAPAPAAAEVRQRALAALESAEAWQITTTCNGQRDVERWSAHSGAYRWDSGAVGSSHTQMDTDGMVLIGPAPDGTIVGRPLGPAAGRLPNATAFTAYYAHLKEGKPISVEAVAGGQIKVVLRGAPSSLCAVLDSVSYLPVKMQGKSEETGAVGEHLIHMSPISVDALKSAVAELWKTPPRSYPDATPKDHLLNALRAAGIDCFRVDTYANSEKNACAELFVQAPAGEANHEFASRVASLVREDSNILRVDIVSVALFTLADEWYDETFDLGN